MSTIINPPFSSTKVNELPNAHATIGTEKAVVLQEGKVCLYDISALQGQNGEIGPMGLQGLQGIDGIDGLDGLHEEPINVSFTYNNDMITQSIESFESWQKTSSFNYLNDAISTIVISPTNGKTRTESYSYDSSGKITTMNATEI
jgi:hypothetical protein